MGSSCAGLAYPCPRSSPAHSLSKPLPSVQFLLNLSPPPEASFFSYGAETGLFYAAGTCTGALGVTMLCRTDELLDMPSSQQADQLCAVKLANEKHDQLLSLLVAYSAWNICL